MMIGGPTSAVDRLRPIFETLAPSPKTGWGHVGPAGAGHFVKMVHNGIEYGMMQSFAEGFQFSSTKRTFARPASGCGNLARGQRSSFLAARSDRRRVS